MAPAPILVMKRLNVRRAPNTGADVVGTLQPGDPIGVRGFTQGETVENNPVWYEIGQRQFVWAGGTDRPKPV